MTSPTCTGPCSAGYVCAPGATTPTEVQCPGGKYSLEGALVCTNCTAGRYSSDVARPVACTQDCPAGSFCVEGAAVPEPCQAGRFGNTTGLTLPACTAKCSVGAYCPLGAVNPTPCPAGACLCALWLHARMLGAGRLRVLPVVCAVPVVMQLTGCVCGASDVRCVRCVRCERPYMTCGDCLRS